MNFEGGKLNKTEEPKEDLLIPENELLSPEEKEIKEKILDASKTPYPLSKIPEIIPEKLLRDKEVQEAAKETFLKEVKEGYISSSFNFNEYKKRFEFSDEILEEQVVKEAAYEGAILNLSKLNSWNVLAIVDLFKLNKELFNTPEIRENISKNIAYDLNYRVDMALKMQDKFKSYEGDFFDQENIRKIAEEKIAKSLGYFDLEVGNRPYEDQSVKAFENAAEIQNAIKVENNVVEKEKITNLAKKAFVEVLNSYSAPKELAPNIFKTFKLDKSIFAEEGMKEEIRRYMYNNFEKESDTLLEDLGMDKETITGIAQGMVLENLGFDIYHTQKLIKRYDVPKDSFKSPGAQESLKNFVLSSLEKGFPHSVLEFREDFNISESILHSPEVMGILGRSVGLFLQGQIATKGMEDDDIVRFEWIIKEFGADTSMIENDAGFKDSIIGVAQTRLNRFELDKANKLKDKFGIDDKTFDNMAIQSIRQALIQPYYSGDIGSLIDYAKVNLEISDEILAGIGKEAVLEKLRNPGMIGGALLISEKLGIKLSIEQIVSELPDVKDFLEQIKSVSESLYEHMETSDDLLYSILEMRRNKKRDPIELLRDNQFLIEAIEKNPRHGPKLLPAYAGFDSSSKNNIKTVFNIWKSVSSLNPDLDPNSKEFRTLVSDELKKYAENSEILEDLNKSGVNLDEWLKYDKKDVFKLGAKEDVLFSDKISPPVIRIAQTIDLYAKTLGLEADKYKDILGNIKQGGEIDETKIANLVMAKYKAKEAGNEIKVRAIELEIEKASQSHETTLLDQFRRQIGFLGKLKKNLILSRDQLDKLENSNASGSSIGNSKEDLRLKFIALRKAIDSFKNGTFNKLKDSLGEEEWSELDGRINVSMQEEFIHLQDDINDMYSFFSTGEENKKENLSRNKMSVSVWERDPNVDLYLGNYCPCCISIESGQFLNGQHSAISDYITDLGIQVVTIKDETKGIPVAAAWTWLSKDKNGKPVMVVDNIEANTLYSSNFPEKLETHLMEYLKDYAKAINAGRLVLGTRNNDLPSQATQESFKMSSEKYKKTITNGGNEYYLEAEDDDTVVVWENS